MHVISDKLLSSDVVVALEAGGGVAEVKTINGATITIELIDDNVVPNGSSITFIVDLEPDNGVAHVINQVILPPSNSLHPSIFHPNNPSRRGPRPASLRCSQQANAYVSVVPARSVAAPDSNLR